MAEEFHGENRRNGDRFLFEQLSGIRSDLSRAAADLAREMNEVRERHHRAINDLSGTMLKQYMDTRDDLAKVKAQVSQLALRVNEHTHPEILLKVESLHASISDQLLDLKTSFVVDRAEDHGAAKQRTSTKAIIGWTLGSIGALLGTVTAIIGIWQAMT